MKANELRIGNWLLHKLENKPHQITTISRHPEHDSYLVLFGYIPQCSLEFMDPIPLTEEWLLRFGFIDGNLELNMDSDTGCIDTIYFNEGYIGTSSSEYYGRHNIKYVHQLQNLYFALAGEELKTKSLTIIAKPIAS